MGSSKMESPAPAGMVLWLIRAGCGNELLLKPAAAAFCSADKSTSTPSLVPLFELRGEITASTPK